MNKTIDEKQIVTLIAMDRLCIPLSSMYQKVKKKRKSEAKGLAALIGELEDSEFEGERTYAYVGKEDHEKARGMKEAVAEFKIQYPAEGEVLQQMINEKRKKAEEHLYFGINQGKRLTTDDYVTVMQSLGLSEQVARNLYPDLLNVSRKLAQAREEERSVLIGGYDSEED